MFRKSSLLFQLAAPRRCFLRLHCQSCQRLYRSIHLRKHGSPANSGCTASLPSPFNNAAPASQTSVSFGLNSASGPFITASSSRSDSVGLSTNGQMLYYIEVTGPGTTALVDVNYLAMVTGQYSSLGSGDNASLNTGAVFSVGPYQIADTELHVSATTGGAILSNTSINAGYSSATGTWSGSLSGPDTITLTTGIDYLVTLDVQANCAATSGPGIASCSTSAAVDPTFLIDPSQVNGSQYSLLFSSGIGNGTAAVSAAQTIVGAARWRAHLTAFVGRRRRRTGRAVC